MRKDRISVQTDATTEAQLDELAAALCVRPAQVASMLLAEAAAQRLASLRAARGQPLGSLAVSAAPSNGTPPGSPREATAPRAESRLESPGNPPGIRRDAAGQPNPSHSLEGSLCTEENSLTQRESEGEKRCPRCSGALHVRWVRKAGRDKLGCENYDEKKAKKAGLKQRCGYMCELDEAQEAAPSLAKPTQEAKRQLYDAMAQKHQEDVDGVPSELDNPERLARLVSAKIQALASAKAPPKRAKALETA